MLIVGLWPLKTQYGFGPMREGTCTFNYSNNRISKNIIILNIFILPNLKLGEIEPVKVMMSRIRHLNINHTECNGETAVFYAADNGKYDLGKDLKKIITVCSTIEFPKTICQN